VIQLAFDVPGPIKLIFYNERGSIPIDFSCNTISPHSAICQSESLLNADLGEYLVRPTASETIGLWNFTVRVRAPADNQRLLCYVGRPCVIGQVDEDFPVASDRIEISLTCEREGSVAADTFPSKGVAPFSHSGFFGWDSAADFSRVTVGQYRLCWSALQDNEYVYNYDIGTLKVLGPVAHQLFVCYERTPCAADNFPGSGLRGEDILAVIFNTSACTRDAFSRAVPDFPNNGVSFPSNSGVNYTFGRSLVNISSFPPSIESVGNHAPMA